MSEGLQDRYAPENRCFGCGPANEKGLRIKSRVEGDELVCDFTPEEHHQAFGGVLNGGIIGTLLDCHSNWAAAYHLMRARGLDAPPCTVTADFHVKLKRPTPLAPVRVRARVVSAAEAGGPGAEPAGPAKPPDVDRVEVEATLEAGGRVTATCVGTFVAVKEGHPAYHRW
ncbi:MAG: PaaI family thioesterase [Polyangiaceae bacterium]|nr:PaaI family thioesterase [Polyangiaceae bacterium]